MIIIFLILDKDYSMLKKKGFNFLFLINKGYKWNSDKYFISNYILIFVLILYLLFLFRVLVFFLILL